MMQIGYDFSAERKKGSMMVQNSLNILNFQPLITFFAQMRQVEANDMFISKVNKCNGVKTVMGTFNSRSKHNSTRLQ